MSERTEGILLAGIFVVGLGAGVLLAINAKGASTTAATSTSP